MYRDAALDEVRSEFPRYFEALAKHPRLLIGVEVPAIGKEGSEVLRDTNDAKDWQDAVKQILAEEVRDRMVAKSDNDSDTITMLHSSIELFQNNNDLVPGTRQFDKELADRFAMMAKPYEFRVEGKLQGYTIPVQPLIEQVRGELRTIRASRTAAASAAAAPATGSAETPASRGPGRPRTAAAPPPQAGITSKAGESTEPEDFSTLFGTIGLPNFRI